MIYLDSSVLLADLFAEARFPPEALWDGDLVSSRLLSYEVWNRVNARGLADSHGERARALLSRVSLASLSDAALARALEPWPAPLRTLDALHLATIEYLRGAGEAIELASYDGRLLATARSLGIDIAAL